MGIDERTILGVKHRPRAEHRAGLFFYLCTPYYIAFFSSRRFKIRFTCGIIFAA